MNPFRVFALLLFAFTRADSGLVGQTPRVSIPLDSGTLVRMTPQAGAPVLGRLVQKFGPASSELRFCRYSGRPCTEAADSGAIRTMPAASLFRLEVQRGTHLQRGALIGGMAGAALTLIAWAEREPCDQGFDCGPSLGRVLVIFTSGGAALGALLGAVTPAWGPPR